MLQLPNRFARLMVGTAALGLFALPSAAEMPATVNTNINTGLIEMPSGEAQPDGFLTLGALSLIHI